MDDKEDDKKRVLTPPSEWAEGMKPSDPPQLVDDFDEDTDWLDEDDFAREDDAAQDTAEPSEEDDETILDEDHGDHEEEEAPSASDALLADHQQASQPSGTKKTAIIPWAVAGVLLLALVGVAGKWLDDRSKAETANRELQASLAAAQKNTGIPEAEAQALRDDNAGLRAEISVLEDQYNQAMKELEEAKQAATAAVEASRQSSRSAPAASGARMPVQSTGIWFVNVESHTDSALANSRMRDIGSRFRSLTFETARARVNGRIYHRVRAAGFNSQAEATQAAKLIADVLGTGPLWVGKDSDSQAARPSVAPKQPAPQTQVVSTQVAPKPIRLKNMSRKENWFIFVETFDQEPKADAVASDLIDKGWDAKVAVEARSGELFYRVQVVGIDNERVGNEIVAELKSSGDYGNARLRKAI